MHPIDFYGRREAALVALVPRNPIKGSLFMDNVTLIRLVAGLLAILVLPVLIVPYWKIFSKAGFSGWLALLMILPLANLIVLYVVAFSEWRQS
jgi:hypothetical protein